MTRTRRNRVLATALALVAVATAPSAFGHAEITPGHVDPGQRVTLTIESIVERPNGLMNVDIQVVVPRQWKALDCEGPDSWTCRLDAKTYKPHTVAVFTPALTATPRDTRFTVDVQAPPKAAGIYLFRTLQKHFDGFTEPWVYDHEPYPAPQVQVGRREVLVNPEGSREDPKCFGPSKQPKDYFSHDGSRTDKGCPGAAPQPVRRGYGGGQPVLRVDLSR